MIVFMAMFPVTSVLFQTAVHVLGGRLGYWIGFAAYWTLLTGITLAVVGRRGIRRLYVTKRREGKYWALLAFVPAIATFFIAFLPSIDALTASLWLLLVTAALINGTVEELFWRGLPLHLTRQGDKWMVWVTSLIGFGLWHVTLALLPGIHYRGGFGALVGGAAGMGLLWLLVTIKTDVILFATLAHVLVNLFAFSELLVDNWGG